MPRNSAGRLMHVCYRKPVVPDHNDSGNRAMQGNALEL